jgi:DGQHR domain-containing protein
LDTELYPYIPIEQPVGTFFLSKINAVKLVERIDILRRGLTERERHNVQRKLNPKRTREIAAYLGDPDATFPTSVIISVYPEMLEAIDEKTNVIRFKPDGKIGEVIDGQHRLEGIRQRIDDGEAAFLKTFDLPVVFMLDLVPEDKAYVFSIINSKQTPVSSSLIFDLFGLRESRSPRKTCHDIAEAFNADPKGPSIAALRCWATRSTRRRY